MDGGCCSGPGPRSPRPCCRSSAVLPSELPSEQDLLAEVRFVGPNRLERRFCCAPADAAAPPSPTTLSPVDLVDLLAEVRFIDPSTLPRCLRRAAPGTAAPDAAALPSLLPESRFIEASRLERRLRPARAAADAAPADAAPADAAAPTTPAPNPPAPDAAAPDAASPSAAASSSVDKRAEMRFIEPKMLERRRPGAVSGADGTFPSPPEDRPKSEPRRRRRIRPGRSFVAVDPSSKPSRSSVCLRRCAREVPCRWLPTAPVPPPPPPPPPSSVLRWYTASRHSRLPNAHASPLCSARSASSRAAAAAAAPVLLSTLTEHCSLALTAGWPLTEHCLLDSSTIGSQPARFDDEPAPPADDPANAAAPPTDAPVPPADAPVPLADAPVPLNPLPSPPAAARARSRCATTMPPPQRSGGRNITVSAVRSVGTVPVRLEPPPPGPPEALVAERYASSAYSPSLARHAAVISTLDGKRRPWCIARPCR